jgi:hypothetical protein
MGRADVVDGVGGERVSDHVDVGVVAAATLAEGQAATMICSSLLCSLIVRLRPCRMPPSSASEKDDYPGATQGPGAGHLLFGHGLPQASVIQDDWMSCLGRGLMKFRGRRAGGVLDGSPS